MTAPKNTIAVCEKCGEPKGPVGQGRRLCDECRDANPWWQRPAHATIHPIDEPVPVTAPPRVDGLTKPSKWDPVIDRLRQHPGQWFVVAQHAGAHTPDYLRELAKRRGVDLEVQSRVGGPRKDRTLRIYARCLPGGAAPGDDSAAATLLPALGG